MQRVSSPRKAGPPLEPHLAASSLGGVDQVLCCPELSLLLACLRTDPETVGPRLTELLKQDLSWDYLLDMAAWHGVIPLLAKRLVGHPSVPPGMVERLTVFARVTAAKNLFLSAELIKLSTALTAHGIQHIPYKGTVLSQYLYGSTALRSVSDIDVVIRSEDVTKTIACLEELGFEDGFGLSSSQRETAMSYCFEYSFVRGEITVDLHWRLVQHFAWPSLEMARLWDSLVPFQFYGSEVRVFSPEWMLAALCIHCAQHDWRELKMLADIAELLAKHPRMDWRVLENLTADSHSRRSILVALSLIHTYLGASLPSLVSVAIDKDRQVKQIANRVYLTSWPSRHDPIPANVDMHWLWFRTKGERWIDRLRYIGSMALGPTMADFWGVNIPRSFAWLYFAVRPLRIISARLKRLCK
jgi:Uncharacterised nucleotidyltransferase